MVGNRSNLYRDHPDWVVKERMTGGPLVQWRLYGEYRWHKRSEEYYILDATHPEAFDYLRHVFHTWRHEWGCEYFKTDFMYWGSEYGPDRAVWYKPGKTRMEIWRQVAEMIREEMGDAIWLGCGCPLYASVGLVDGIRIGFDVGVEWTGYISAQSLLRDLASRNYANHILWQIDPDSVLLRDHFHSLTDAEVRSLAIYAGMGGGVMTTSDGFHEISPARIKLWKLVTNSSRAICSFPLLGQSAIVYDRIPNDSNSPIGQHKSRLMDPVLVQVRQSLAEKEETKAVFIFNTGDFQVQRSYSLCTLGLPSPLYICDWIAGMIWSKPTEIITVTLAPHDGALFFVCPEPFDSVPERLP